MDIYIALQIPRLQKSLAATTLLDRSIGEEKQSQWLFQTQWCGMFFAHKTPTPLFMV